MHTAFVRVVSHCGDGQTAGPARGYGNIELLFVKSHPFNPHSNNFSLKTGFLAKNSLSSEDEDAMHKIAAASTSVTCPSSRYEGSRPYPVCTQNLPWF